MPKSILRVTKSDRTLAGKIVANYHDHGWRAEVRQSEGRDIDETTFCYQLISPQEKRYDVSLQKFEGTFFKASWVIICSYETDSGDRMSNYSGTIGLTEALLEAEKLVVNKNSLYGSLVDVWKALGID